MEQTGPVEVIPPDGKDQKHLMFRYANGVTMYHVDIYKHGEYRWEWARQLIDLGDALIGRDGPGDREKAQETYQQSLNLFKEMGARGYIKVVNASLDGITAQPSK